MRLQLSMQIIYDHLGSFWGTREKFKKVKFKLFFNFFKL